MSQHFKRLILILLLLFIWSCAPKTSTVKIDLPPGTLSAPEVTTLFSGKTVESVLISNGRISLTYYDPNGELQQLQNGARRAGTWRVRKDGRICLAIEQANDKCRIIVKEGGIYKKYIVKLNGRHQHIIDYRSFRDGNLLGL